MLQCNNMVNITPVASITDTETHAQIVQSNDARRPVMATGVARVMDIDQHRASGWRISPMDRRIALSRQLWFRLKN